MKKKLIILVFSFILFAPTFINAETYIISNSEDWRDVYSTLMYANLRGLNSDFLINEEQGKSLLTDIDKGHTLLIITSKNNPIIPNSISLASSEGFNSVEEIEVSSANLELIDKLRYIKNFIIVDDSYGYNAMAVVAYALATDSWVFLANNNNIDEIDSILKDRADKVLIYGYANSELIETLSKYNTEMINTGDKFQDNIEIVKKYSEIGSISQVIISNGEFIEREIMQGKNSLIFIEDDMVTQKIADYIKSSDIEIGVLIGNELIGAATKIRQSAGINVMIKFARSARERTSGVSPREGLDLFYITSSEIKTTSYPIQTLKQEEKDEIIEYTPTETSTQIEQEESNQITKPTNIQIPPGNNQPITGEAISEQGFNSKNNLFLSSLIIGIAMIVGFAILAVTLKKR